MMSKSEATLANIRMQPSAPRESNAPRLMRHR